MMRNLALLLSSLAERALPPDREEWGAAMGAEVEHIEEHWAALAFSLGCVSAALKERAKHVPSLAVAGLWSLAFITAASATYHLGCAVRGTGIVLGSPDPYF